MREYNEKKIIKGLIAVVIFSILLGGVGYVVQYKSEIVKSDNEIAEGKNISNDYKNESNEVEVDISNDKFNINTTKEFAKENVKTINVETGSTDVNIITTKEDKIKIHFYGNTNSKKSAPYLESSANGDNLDILIKHPVAISAININTKTNLDIYVSENYKNNLEIKTTSGNTIIGQLQLDKFKVGTTSGNVKINKLTVNKAIFESTSGEVNVESLLSKNNEFNTTSGEITIENITGDILGESVSGSFKFAYNEYDNDINIDTTSGDVELKLPKKSEFKLDFDSTSGDLENDFPITVSGESEKHEIKGNVGNGNKRIKINTTSGDASISDFDD